MIDPLDETVRPAPLPAKVTAPMLPFVLSWLVKAPDPVVVTEPDVELVWVMRTGLTVRL